MGSTFLLIAGSILAFLILIYMFYLVFFPLGRTIGGGFQILWSYAFKRKKLEKEYREGATVMVDPDLGLTMADGGERRDEKKR
ncbi:MAG: hypothetical protein N2745_02350 [Syntrophorhabdaceae bacterium]|nr:hypothetical protein [Syntrophorhabdaceae bacterium]